MHVTPRFPAEKPPPWPSRRLGPSSYRRVLGLARSSNLGLTRNADGFWPWRRNRAARRSLPHDRNLLRREVRLHAPLILFFVDACAIAVPAASAAPAKNSAKRESGVMCVLHAKLSAESETGSTSTATGHTLIKGWRTGRSSSRPDQTTARRSPLRISTREP